MIDVLEERMDDGRVRRTGGWMMDVLEERVDDGRVRRTGG